jgi:hypothetical protein
MAKPRVYQSSLTLVEDAVMRKEAEMERTISKRNVRQLLNRYLALVDGMGNPSGKFTGLRLLEVLKRKPVQVGPYPKVTLFEAANRIMSDLVILYGVKWLLDNGKFPFDSYLVEYGNEDKNGFDIHASSKQKTLLGEAFNVAPLFFQRKKASMLKKLRGENIDADYKLIMFNRDAVKDNYRPKLRHNEYFLFVDVSGGECFLRSHERPDAGTPKR